MATYNGSDKRLGYLFQNGGGGGSSTLGGLSDVNLTTPTDGQVLKYDANAQEWINANESGGGTGGGFSVDVLFSGDYYDTSTSQALSASYTQYDFLLVEVCAKASYYHSKQTAFIQTSDIQGTSTVGGEFALTMINPENTNYQWELRFGFPDGTHIKINDKRLSGWSGNSPMITKVLGLKSGTTHHYSATEQVVGTWIDGKPIYEKTISFTNTQSSFSDYVTVESLTGVDKVIKMEWTAFRSANNAFYTGNGGAVTESANYNTYRIMFRYSKALEEVQYFIGGYGTEITDMTVTIQYTKV